MKKMPHNWATPQDNRHGGICASWNDGWKLIWYDTQDHTWKPAPAPEGYCPSMLPAPKVYPGDKVRFRWIADTFLTGIVQDVSFGLYQLEKYYSYTPSIRYSVKSNGHGRDVFDHLNGENVIERVEEQVENELK